MTRHMLFRSTAAAIVVGVVTIAAIQTTDAQVRAGRRGAAVKTEEGGAVVTRRGAAVKGDEGYAAVGRHGAVAAGENGAAAVGRRGAVAVGEEGAAAVGRRGAVVAGEEGYAAVGRRGGVVVGDNYESPEAWRRARPGVVVGVGTMFVRPPSAAVTIAFGGSSYWVHDNVYYTRVMTGGKVAYQVCGPPAGIVIRTLPVGCASARVGNVVYQRCGATYYQRVSTGYRVAVIH